MNEADRLDLVDPERLRAELKTTRPRPGIAALRSVLDRATFTLTDSELERRFLRVARRAGFPAPQTGVLVNGFTVDFYWPSLGIVVETDGLRYHRTPLQQSRDRRRDLAHAAAGLTPLRFTHAMGPPPARGSGGDTRGSRQAQREFRKTGGVIPVIGSAAVLAAVSPSEAIERTRLAFERHAAGEWVMPSKVYLDSPPGDFRAMPARGDGLAIVKWVTSFPGNPSRGLPVVSGAIFVSDADTGEPLAVVDGRSVTWLRTGAAAAVSALALAASAGSAVGLIGSGVNGAWVARCLAAAGFGPGVCHDPRAEAAERLASELGWTTATREDAAGQPVVVSCTPGDQPVILGSDLRPGLHLAVLGADGPGKREVEIEAIRHCRLFCEGWEQASAGGELAAPVAAGGVRRSDVTEIGDVLRGVAPGRLDPSEVTLFDSTGLAIQDLGIVTAVYAAWKAGGIDVPTVDLA